MLENVETHQVGQNHFKSIVGRESAVSQFFFLKRVANGVGHILPFLTKSELTCRIGKIYKIFDMTLVHPNFGLDIFFSFF